VDRPHVARRATALTTRPAKRSRMYTGDDAHMAHQAKGLTWDEARPIAAGIARLPELMATRERATAADE
jgi:hypothetical protein